MSYTHAPALRHPRLWVLALASAALSCTVTLALAQTTTSHADASDTANAAVNQPGVTVRAHRMVKHQIVTNFSTYGGLPIEQIQLTREVGYNDLNLSTPQGADALKQRIRMTAEEACRQLSSLYPLNVWTTSNESCVQNATKMAMDQVPAAVASAEHRRRGTPE